MSIIHIAFYPSDWLAGTRGLTDAETGVYITIISRIYEMAGPIERDDNRLARLCGCKSRAAFARSLEHLISEGKIVETDQGLTNERAEKEIKNTTEKSDKAKAAAQSRWDRKPSKNKGSSNAGASPKHMPQPCQSESEPELKKEDTNVSLSVSPPAIDEIAECVSAYNAEASRWGWPKVQSLNKKRRAALAGRLREADGTDGWRLALKKAGESDFLTGRASKQFFASFDFLTQQSSFAKLMEGNYDNRTGNTNHGNGNRHSGTADAFLAVAARYANGGAGGGGHDGF